MKGWIETFKEILRNNKMVFSVVPAIIAVVVLGLLLDIQTHAAAVDAYEFSVDFTSTFTKEGYEHCGNVTSQKGIWRVVPEDGYLYAIWKNGNGKPYYNFNFKRNKKGAAINKEEDVIGTYSYTYVDRDGTSGVASLECSTISMPLDIYVSSDWTYGPGTYSTNLPVFDNEEALVNYYLTGDDSGRINKSEDVSLDDFSLTGFQVDNSIHATWTGISSSREFDLSEVYVNISPQYFITLEAGEEQQDFESPGVIQVPLTDFSFSKAYDDYFVNNPYAGRAQLILYFYPTYDDRANLYLYRGKSIKVMFDVNGNVTNLDIPESSITPEYNKEFSFLNFTSTSEFHNWGDSFIHCYWTGTTVDGVVDYTYSDIKVEIYAEYGEYLPEPATYAHKWLNYPLNEIVYFSQRKLSLNLSELHEYALTQDCRFYGTDNWKGKKIRITPYYKTGTEYVYGKPVEISLTTFAGIGSILQKDEETGTYEDLEKDYLTDNGVLDGLLDDVVNGSAEAPDLEGITVNLFSLLMGMFAACGQLPALVAMVFGFLPSYFTTMMVVALSLVIVLRLIGR